MPREIVLGNGNVLVNLDNSTNLRDFYYPYVGMENHIMGHRCGLGIWADGIFSWIDRKNWQIKCGYRPSSLIGKSVALHEEKGLELHFDDFVYCGKNIFLRKVTVLNLRAYKRELQLFFHNDFSLGGVDVGDTVLFDPDTGALLHYKRKFYFLFNGRWRKEGFYQHTTGIKRFGHREGTWRDAEDGHLSNNPIAQGSVDSVASFKINLDSRGEEVAYYWIIAGRNFKEVEENNSYVLEQGPETMLKTTESYWYNWAHKYKRSFVDLSPEIEELFYTSLLIVRTHFDNRGAFIAANDTDIMSTNRDHYSYLWPRDGALVAHAMDKAGYPTLTTNFYGFCQRLLTKEGFFLPKYNPDGSVGSSWHPWVKEKYGYWPIQEDETALVLWAIGQFYHTYRGFEFVKLLYSTLILPAADFLAEYRDARTGLPLESYDIWEERKGSFTFTAASVYGGLQAAAYLGNIFGDEARANKWKTAARQVRAGIFKHLYSQELARFIRGIKFKEDGSLEKDFSLESSLYGIFAFGVLPARHPRVVRTMQAIHKGLWVDTPIGGVARYSGDYYFRQPSDPQKAPGNPWFICTLWLALWYIEVAHSPDDLSQARHLLNWTVKWKSPSGMLAEQIHPYTGEQLSVSPLTWSHAAFIQAVLSYVEKYCRLTGMDVKPFFRE